MAKKKKKKKRRKKRKRKQNSLAPLSSLHSTSGTRRSSRYDPQTRPVPATRTAAPASSLLLTSTGPACATKRAVFSTVSLVDGSCLLGRMRSSGGDLARAQVKPMPACAECRGTRNFGRWVDRCGFHDSSTLRLSLCIDILSVRLLGWRPSIRLEGLRCARLVDHQGIGRHWGLGKC